MALYPFTKPQQSVWNMEQYHGGSIANITASVMFADSVNTEALQASLNTILERYDSLRIRLNLQSGTPQQYIRDFMPRAFEVKHFLNKNQFHDWVETLAKTPFDITDDLYRFAIIKIGEEIGFVLHLHHLIADAWTMHMLVNAVMQKLKGNEIHSYSYLDYLEGEKRYQTSTQYQNAKEYFLQCFMNCSESVCLADRQSMDASSGRFCTTVPIADSEKIQSFCTQNDLSLYSLFMNTLAVYIYRIKGEQDLYIGTPILNRSGKKEKATAGMFVNTVPVLFHIDETETILENLQRNGANILSVFRHQKYQYVDLLKDIRKQHNFSGRLFDVVLSYQIGELSQEVSVDWHFCGRQSESLNLHLNDRNNDGTFHFDYTFQTELFTHGDIERLHESFLNLILDTIENPDKLPQELKLLSDEEYRRVVYSFNNTKAEYPGDKCIHQLFEEQTERSPDAVAVVFEGIEYTYRQINQMANSLARHLREKGVVRDDIVAIVAQRSYKIIIAQLAVLKAGGAYMPIDPKYPRERIDFMLKDAKCKTALVLGASVDGIDLDAYEIYCGCHENLDSINTPEDICYLIYTSGSTGLPKGAIITHRNFVNFCTNNGNVAIANEAGCKSFFCLGNFSFDMASAEVYLALLNQKRLVLPNEKQLNNPIEIARLIAEYSVDFILSVPTRILSYLDDSSFAKIASKLKVLSLGGESLTEEIVAVLKKNTNAFILNGYGPAETTMGCTLTDTDGNTSIGKPIANTQIYILDKNMSPLPIGATGQIFISGDGVGREYLNRPKLTAEKFIPNPFIKGTRMYKTGDLARWCENGNIEFVGRMDYQVKIRGMRIELGEIEAAIAGISGVRQAIVMVQEDGQGRSLICAYYTGQETEYTTFKQELSKSLPQHMIPHFFMWLEDFPTTAGGKTDRKMLPLPDFTQSNSMAEYTAPLTEPEKKLAGLFETVLGLSPVGMNDNFFDLGGDSLKAIEFAAKAHNIGIFIDVQSLFEHPTPASLLQCNTAKHEQPARYQKDDFATIDKLLANNTQRPVSESAKRPLGDILITGATGWLGAHVLDAFLSGKQGKAYCLVRGTDLNDSRKRLQAVLKTYFRAKYADCDRIVVIRGDVTDKISVENPIDTIIHCAANVKHYGTYRDSYTSNVIGTKNIISLAEEKQAKLWHISTASVSGNSFGPSIGAAPLIFDETKLFIGQRLENVYVRSKFESECAVLEAISDGLNAAIIRVGNLSNRRSDLMFQQNHTENAVLSRLKAFIDLGVYPEKMADYPLEFSPVDETANAILVLTQHFNKEFSLYHAYNHNTVHLSEFIHAVQNAGIRVNPASETEFRRALDAAGKNPEMAHILNAFIHDTNADGQLNFNGKLVLNSDFSIWTLKRFGFSWSEIDADYLDGYINYFRSKEYWGDVQ